MVSGTNLTADKSVPDTIVLMHGMLAALRRLGLGIFFLFCSQAIQSRIHIPMLRRIVCGSKHFDAGPGASIPAVYDLLPDPIPQLVAKGSLDFQRVVSCNACCEVYVGENQDRDEEIFRIGFCHQHSAAGIAISLKEQVVGFVVFSPRSALNSEECFVLAIQALELLTVRRAVLAGLRLVRITYNTWDFRLYRRRLFRHMASLDADILSRRREIVHPAGNSMTVTMIP